MSLKRKNRAGQGDGCHDAPGGDQGVYRYLTDNEAAYWRLAVLFGLGLMIFAIHGLGHLGAWLPRHEPTYPMLDNRMVWTTGRPEGDGLCQVDWLAELAGIPQESLPRLALVHFSEGQQVIAAGIHPRAALLFFQPIPLNLADAEVLAALPGIGPALAARIVGKREELGGFQSLKQLRQVRGIGAKTLENIQDRLTI